jgi:hypothetical protein
MGHIGKIAPRHDIGHTDLREGKAVEIRTYPDIPEALANAGLAEADADHS